MTLQELPIELKRLTNDWPHDAKRTNLLRAANDRKALLGLCQRIALNTKGVSRQIASELLNRFHNEEKS